MLLIVPMETIDSLLGVYGQGRGAEAVGLASVGTDTNKVLAGP